MKQEATAWDPKFLRVGVRLTARQAALAGPGLPVLLGGWARFSDHLADSDGPDMDDLIRALADRSVLQTCIDEAPRELAVRLSRAIAAADRRFFARTVHDDEGLVLDYAGRRADDSWWWQRIPKHGRARKELDYRDGGR